MQRGRCLVDVSDVDRVGQQHASVVERPANNDLDVDDAEMTGVK